MLVSPSTRTVATEALELPAPLAAQVDSVALVIASGSSCHIYFFSPPKDSAAEGWSIPAQACWISKPMFCPQHLVVTGRTELSLPKMN